MDYHHQQKAADKTLSAAVKNKSLFILKIRKQTPELILWNKIAVNYCFRIFRLRTMFCNIKLSGAVANA